MEIRDPIHGAIALSPDELRVADDRWVQRLRWIRQTGFSQLSFPGATHTRYLHSLGVMELAGRAFDQAYRDWSFDQPDARQRFRATVRLAALCHDVGHAPFSHCMEFCMPPLASLGLTWRRHPRQRQATHEDYTVAILEHTSLGRAIDGAFAGTARHVAALIDHEVRPGDDFFVDGGLDHRRCLSQLISSELDVDRMDYLVRDALFTGARYGQVDTGWLLSNLSTWVADGSVTLALDGRAVYAFDHFLLARHHMFLMVYFHHKSVIYEELLRRYVSSDDSDWVMPSDLDHYLAIDDSALMEHLRHSSHEMARRVVEQRPYRRLLERHGDARSAEHGRVIERLEGAGIDVVSASSTGRLSRYERFGSKRRRAAPIYVLDSMGTRRRATPLPEATQVFMRYADERVISRLYVPPERLDDARALL
jgi:HD superfamily phosphohydrolase